MDFLLPILTIIGIHFVAVVSPGPNFFISAKHGLSYSRPAGLSTTTGVAVGTLIHISLGFLGLSALVAQSIWLYTLLKYAGALYLIYLGVKTWWTQRQTPHWGELYLSEPGVMSPKRAFWIGLITCLTNPKSVLYWLAIFTSVVSVNSSFTVKVAVIALLPIVSWLWYSLVALSFSLQSFRQIYYRFYSWVEAIFGLLMVGLGLRILFFSK